MSDCKHKSKELEQAEIKKAEAEARKSVSESKKLEQEAREAQYKAETALIELEKKRETEQRRKVEDEYLHIYRFSGEVSSTSVNACIKKLSEWHRLDGKCKITVIFDSPGGSIIDGFQLYDEMLSLRKLGHHITTMAQGMAASMAGVLLQGGDVRIMGARSQLLIHEASFGTAGSYGQVEDTMKWVKQMQGQILDILAERSKLSRISIKRRWARKNWWLSAKEALKHGFIDEID